MATNRCNRGTATAILHGMNAGAPGWKPLRVIADIKHNREA